MGVLLPMWLFANPRVRASRGALLGTALLLIAGMMLNRINASLLALAAVPRISYLPSLEEWLISLGIIALGVLGYRALDRLRIGTH